MSKKILDQLTLLHSLIRSFEKSEVTVLLNFLSAFESRRKGFKPKGTILTELILKHDSPEEVLTRFRKKLGKDSLDAARMQISRLRAKVYEAMSLTVNLNKEGYLSETGKAIHQIQSKTFLTQLLDVKGHRELSNIELDQAIKLAKEFEHYADLMDLLIIKRERTRGLALMNQHKKVNEELAFYRSCLLTYWNARDVVEQLATTRVTLASQADSTGKFSKAISEALPSLEQAFEQTGSAKIGVHFYSFQCEQFQLNEDYEGANESFNHWLDLTMNNASIKGDVRISNIHMNIAQNNIFAFNFKDAIEHVKIGAKLLVEGSKAHYMAIEQEFYANLYDGNIAESLGMSRELVEAAAKHGFKNKAPQWNFFAAAAEYCSVDYKAARKYLLDTAALRTDRQGHNIAVRVFEIIVDIDSEKFDVADAQINNLRQFIKEGLKDSDVRKRDQLILQILLDLRRASYLFADLEESTLDLWRELFGKGRDVNWIPECAELIPFHLWFTYKHRNLPYSAKLSSELIHTPYI